MKRNILSEVSLSDVKGLLNQLNELLTNTEFGVHNAHLLKRFARGEPMFTLTERWLKQLNDKDTWEDAKSFFRKNKKLWFNEPDWPFQIAVVKVGTLSKDEMKKRLCNNISNKDFACSLVDEMTEPRIVRLKEEVKIVRIRPLYLDYKNEDIFENINLGSQQFTQCLPEVIFDILEKTNTDYYGDEQTYVSMKPLQYHQSGEFFQFMFGGCSNGQLYLSAAAMEPRFKKRIHKNAYFIYTFQIDDSLQ